MSSPLPHSDALTPEQARRLRLWRSLNELSRAGAEGRLTPEQAALLASLAENLRALADRLAELADLGRELLQQVDPPDRRPTGA